MSRLPAVKVYDMGDHALGVCGLEAFAVPYRDVALELAQRRPSSFIEGFDPDVIEAQQMISELYPDELGELLEYLADPYYEDDDGLGDLEGRRSRRRKRKARRKRRRKRIKAKLKKVGNKVAEIARKAAKKGIIRKALYKVASKIPIVKYAAKGGRAISKGVQKAVYKAQKRRGGRILRSGRKRVERGEDVLIKNKKLRKLFRAGGAAAGAAASGAITSGKVPSISAATRAAINNPQAIARRAAQAGIKRGRAEVQRRTGIDPQAAVRMAAQARRSGATRLPIKPAAIARQVAAAAQARRSGGAISRSADPSATLRLMQLAKMRQAMSSRTRFNPQFAFGARAGVKPTNILAMRIAAAQAAARRRA